MPLAPIFPLLYPILKTAFPACLWTGDPKQSEIALTFDDGPHPQYTLELLEVLEKYQIRGSFFWLGVCIERYPIIAQTVYQQGHWIGLHGYDHQSFPCLNIAQLKHGLERTQTVISQTCGLSPTRLRDVRPPNGLFTPQTLKLLDQWQYRAVMWSVVPEDWVLPGVNTVVNRVIQQTQNGSIIVLHDGYYGGLDVAKSTDKIITQLLDKRYRFVTVDRLWESVNEKV